MDIPLKKTSRSKTWGGSESTKEKEDTDVSRQNSVFMPTPLKTFEGLDGSPSLDSSMHLSDRYNMYNPLQNSTTKAEQTAWSRKEYEMEGMIGKKTNKTGLLEGSDLFPYDKHKQNEAEKTESLFKISDILDRLAKHSRQTLMRSFPPDIPQMFPVDNLDLGLANNPTGAISASTIAMKEDMFDHHISPSRHQMFPKNKRSRMRSPFIRHIKHKGTQTEITGRFLSTSPHCSIYLPTKPKTDLFGRAFTKTTANIPPPSYGPEFTHSINVPRSSHSKYPPSFIVDESAAGSSTANFEGEEIMEPIPDDYILPGTSGSSELSSISCLLPCSHSMVSLSKTPCANNNFTQVNSSSDMLLNEFTPVVTDDFDDEIYLFQCSCPGLYQCSVTGLVFLMKGEGDVVYRTVPWKRRLLGQHHKKPAGPLFDIKCQQQSVCQLCLPHCEVTSTGGGQFLKVAHVNDDGIEFITPHRITESHVVINITGFSGYGNVKDEHSPPDPVQALVLLFYKPPVDPDLTSILSVLLLPRNIVIRDVQRTRRKLIGDERYVDTPPQCKLHPKQVYTLSTAPNDDLIKVQPNEADFDDEYRDSYFTSFQVILRRILTDVNLSLKDTSTSSCVWERDVCLFSPSLGTMNVPPSQRLLNNRSCFIEGISAPNLSCLIDKLLEKMVITDAERGEADAMKNKRDKARFIIDTVRNKGDAASSEFINFLRELDKIFFEHLRLN